MNTAKPFPVDLNKPEQFVAFFLSVIVTSAILTVWSAITRTAQAITNLASGRCAA